MNTRHYKYTSVRITRLSTGFYVKSSVTVYEYRIAGKIGIVKQHVINFVNLGKEINSPWIQILVIFKMEKL